MEYFVVQSGEKKGPFAQYKVVELLRDGILDPADKAWHQGLDHWMPMREIPSLQSAVESIGQKQAEEAGAEAETGNPDAGAKPGAIPPPIVQKKVGVAVEVRPLTRFWARYFDYTMVAVVVLMFSDISLPTVDPNLAPADLVTRYEEIFKSGELQQLAKMQFWGLLMWHGLEGILIHLFGTTPGKALFGIHVLTRQGTKLPLIKGIYRSFLVYILGVALFYFHLITFAAMTLSFFRLMARGSTAWDDVLHLRVDHPPLRLWRVLLAILAFFALMMLQFLNVS